jgi:hypothetical protein
VRPASRLRPLSLGLLALFSAALAAPAQETRPPDEPPVKVQVTPDRARATVGDRIIVKVAVDHPPEISVLPPSPVPEDGSTVLVEAIAGQAPSPGPKVASGKLKGPVEDLFLFQAQAFETGKASIPAFRVDWKGPGGKSGSVASRAVPLEIVSVLKGTDEKPADLKPPASLPPPPFPWKIAAMALLALAAIVAALVLWKRRRKPLPQAAPSPAAPQIPAHELAYQELERLLASGLLQEGRIKEFHVELAEILKRYLSGRFGIETLERTSEEVLEEMKRGRVGAAPVGLARELFTGTDLVKFAKHVPLEHEVRLTVDRAYRLVDQTKLAVPSPPSRPAAEGGAPPAFSPETAP